jgi:hypothetical protein
LLLMRRQRLNLRWLLLRLKRFHWRLLRLRLHRWQELLLRLPSHLLLKRLLLRWLRHPPKMPRLRHWLHRYPMYWPLRLPNWLRLRDHPKHWRLKPQKRHRRCLNRYREYRCFPRWNCWRYRRRIHRQNLGRYRHLNVHKNPKPRLNHQMRLMLLRCH